MRKYRMDCPAGSYEAGSWLALGWAIFTHRLHHLFHHGKWVD